VTSRADQRQRIPRTPRSKPAVGRQFSFASFGLILAAAVTAIVTLRLSAHDIPTDVTIQSFVKPEGRRLRVLVEVPLAAMRDLDYPRRGPATLGLLDLARADATLRDAATLWIADFLDVYENETKLPYPTVAAVRASLPSDQSFASYDRALARVTGPRLPPDTEFVWSQGLLDILLEYPIQSERSRFAIEPRFARLGIRTVTVMRFLTPDGAVRAFEVEGNPGLVRLDPRWHQAAQRFVSLGFEHILDGTDHLLFLFCLVIPFRRLRSLVVIVTSFTVAHSVTLIASAYHLAPDALWFPPLIETLIATSIVYMALENIATAAISTDARSAGLSGPRGSGWSSAGLSGPRRSGEITPGLSGPRPAAFDASAGYGGGASAILQRRWLITFAFGLVHGFGFSFALRRTLQFAGSHLLTSLVSFNLGVELGQLLVLVLLVPALGLLFRFVVAERVGTIILSALVAHTAWHWMTERWGVLRQFRFEWPVLDLAFWASAMRWAMLAVALYAAYWLIELIKNRLQQRDAEEAALHER
jgi:hypothetical protein